MNYIYFLFTVLFIVSIISCTESTEPETLFKYTQRSSDYFDIDTTVNHFVIKNPIGFIFLYGAANQSRINYILDKIVWVKNSDLANGEFSKISLSSSSMLDSILCSINFPALPINGYFCTMNLDIPYGKNVFIKNPNNGINTSGLISDLYAETVYENCNVDSHSGSLEVKTYTGNILAQLGIPVNGYCKAISNDGDITVRIPIGSTGSVHLKSTTGTVTYTNLNLTTSKNTDKEVIGTLGNGNETIYLESISGDVWLIGF